MSIKQGTYLFFLLALPFAGMAQVDSTVTDTIPSTAAPDTLATNPDSAKITFKVRPWDYHAPLSSELAATDSTLRWQIWPGWTYKKNRDPGVISYRLGSIGRTNAQLLNAHEPKYQQLFWEDIRLNDPVSGTVNWNYIPHHKIDALYAENLGVNHRTTFYLKEYHLNEPLTQLNYEESSFDTRQLEFVVSRNFGQKTNAEISYWDRRDGGEYNNSGVVGRQIYARVSHQLDQQQEVKLNFLNNNYDNQLPFGYRIANLGTFNFDRFNTSAVESNANGVRGSTVIGLNYYRRPADSSRTTSNLHIGVFSNSIKRDVDYSVDNTSYLVQELGTNVRKWQRLGPLDTEGAVSYSYFINKNEASSNLVTDNWGLAKAEGKATFQPVPFLQVGGHGRYRTRSDGFNDYTIGADAAISIDERIHISAAFSGGSRMATPQQLYWQSIEFDGKPDLENENIESLSGTLEVVPFRGSTVGFKSQLKQIENGIIVDGDSTFSNSNAYSSLSTTGFFDYNSTHFEFSGSATLHQFGNFLTSRSESLPVDENERIWFKGSAYVKGYLFNRATYVKAGLAGMISPQSYASAQYYPALDYWQSAGGNLIPSFNRLDADLTARVRSIIVLLRYENVLDDLVQQGYFETAAYPMTRRRFIFGIRVLLRN